MGVFISCETVEMKLVLAESSSLYLVMLFRTIRLADELLLPAADRHDVERRILHLEIALLVVGIDLQRLLPGVLLLAVKLAKQAPEQVVGKRHLGGIAPDDGLRQVEHRQRLAVHEEDGLPGIEPDDRFVERIDDRLDPRLGRHQVVERTAAVLVELGRHVVERLGNGFELTVAREVEPLPVIMAGNLLDPLLQLVDGAQHHPRNHTSTAPATRAHRAATTISHHMT